MTTLTKCYLSRIEHDNSGYGPGWNLSKVTISSSEGASYFFHSNSWLADDVGDKQCVRDIAASSDPTGASVGWSERYYLYKFISTVSYECQVYYSGHSLVPSFVQRVIIIWPFHMIYICY